MILKLILQLKLILIFQVRKSNISIYEVSKAENLNLSSILYVNNQFDIRKKLQTWAVDHNINHNARQQNIYTLPIESSDIFCYKIDLRKFSMVEIDVCRIKFSDFENTADEAEFRDKKAEKRKHPVNYNDNFDLNAKVKNIKMTSAIKAIANQKSALNDVSSVEEFLEEYQNDDVPTVTETQEIYNSYVIDKPYQDEILACSKADVKQIIKEIVSMEARLYSYIDKKFIEMKKSNSTEKTFKKLLNIHEIEKLKNDLEEDHNFKIILIRKLKSLPVITRHHSECNAKISTFIDFMFDESFIPMIRWSDTPGSKTDGRVCLINYKFVLDLFQNAIAEEIDGVLKLPKSNDKKKSIQNYFKQKNQKNAKKH
ncbi:hypothetical protein PVAND_014242 [Polypedilum vanderplanki]|uniref:DUF4806 domain-containing protein n=1 Tax=Polypedilum vanderplanki TaxID=319348 RepID=A0A9J6CSU5_POLVA|nr:hypothetical protein PVAND_014242 [Polypedilum vanderplanki]